MKLWQSVRMAFQTLLAKKGRSFLTMLGTVIGVTAVIALVSVTKAQNAANVDLWRKLSDNMVYVYFYSYEYNGAPPNAVVERELKNYINLDLQDKAEGVTPAMSDYGNRIRWENQEVEVRQVWYGSEQFSFCQQYELDRGRDISFMDVERANQVAVIGSMTAQRLFSYRDPIGEVIYIKNVPFTIVGVYRQRQTQRYEWQSEEDFYLYSMDNMLVIPYTTTRYIDPNIVIREYMIKVPDPETAFEVVALINEFLGTMINRFDWENYDWEKEGGYIDWSQVNGDYSARTEFQYYESMDEAEEAQTRTLSLIAAISLVVGGIGIMNIMLVTVTERTREIGVRKAIGAPRRTIVTQFLIEATVLSGAGGVLGVLVGFVVTLYWGKWQFDVMAQPDLMITAVAFGGSLLMGILFGIYPAFKAASLQPVDALRTE